MNSSEFVMKDLLDMLIEGGTSTISSGWICSRSIC